MKSPACRRAAIINDDRFHIVDEYSPADNTLQSLAQRRTTIVNWNDDTNRHNRCRIV
jgi:hypothetical protein